MSDTLATFIELTNTKLDTSLFESKNENIRKGIRDISQELQALDIIKDNFGKLLLKLIDDETTNSYCGQSISECQKQEELKEKLLLVKEVLSNE